MGARARVSRRLTGAGIPAAEHPARSQNQGHPPPPPAHSRTLPAGRGTEASRIHLRRPSSAHVDDGARAYRAHVRVLMNGGGGGDDDGGGGVRDDDRLRRRSGRRLPIPLVNHRHLRRLASYLHCLNQTNECRSGK